MTNLVKLAMEGQLDTVPTLSMEEIQLLEKEADTISSEVVTDLSEIEKAQYVVSALEDLAFVADTIDTPNPREAALIQIAADAAMSGTGVDGSTVVPAMEDGGDGKSIATRIKDVIKRVVAAIKELLGNVLKKIITYIIKMLFAAAAKERDLNEKLKIIDKQLKYLQKTNPTALNRTVEIVSLYNKDNVFNDFKEIGNAVRYYDGMMINFVKEYSAITELVCERLSDVYHRVLIGKYAAGLDSFYVGTLWSLGDTGEELKYGLQKTSYKFIDNDKNVGGIEIVAGSARISNDSYEFAKQSSANSAEVIKEFLRNNVVQIKYNQAPDDRNVTIKLPSVQNLKEFAELTSRVLNNASENGNRDSIGLTAKKTSELVDKTCKDILGCIASTNHDSEDAMPFVSNGLFITKLLVVNFVQPYTHLIKHQIRIADDCVRIIDKCIAGYVQKEEK